MTPDKKALDLRKRIAQFLHGGKDTVLETSSFKEVGSVICDEIIEEIRGLEQNCVMEFPMALEYWNKVKGEIEKI
jgi:hypothetical protein